MAKIKNDYIAEGVEDAKAGVPRRYAGNESWQKQAYHSGYTAQVTREQSKMHADIPDGTDVEEMRVSRVKRPDQAVIAHINMLHRMRVTADPMRASRLLRKIATLTLRHANRFMAQVR